MITIENQKYFNLSAIETACNIPRGVLLASIKGLRKLPAKHTDKLNEFLTAKKLKAVIITPELFTLLKMAVCRQSDSLKLFVIITRNLLKTAKI